MKRFKNFCGKTRVCQQTRCPVLGTRTGSVVITGSDKFRTLAKTSPQTYSSNADSFTSLVLFSFLSL